MTYLLSEVDGLLGLLLVPIKSLGSLDYGLSRSKGECDLLEAVSTGVGGVGSISVASGGHGGLYRSMRNEAACRAAGWHGGLTATRRDRTWVRATVRRENIIFRLAVGYGLKWLGKESKDVSVVVVVMSV